MGAAVTIPTSLTWTLPAWVPEVVAGHGPVGASDADRMALVLSLGAAQLEHGTGGPFAAAVFADDTHETLAVGVNLVVPQSACIAHAEMVAFALAGKRLGSFDLGVNGPVTLVTSTEPCAMCIGAVAWSGVRRVVYGSADADARAIGFDEGDKRADWIDALRARNVAVTGGVLADEARNLLNAYAGPVYNAWGAP